MEDNVQSLVRNHYGLLVTGIKEYTSYEDKVFLITVRNYDEVTSKYVLRIINEYNSSTPELIEEICNIQNQISNEGFCVPKSILTTDGRLFFEDNNSQLVTLLNHIEGDILRNVAANISDEQHLNVLSEVGVGYGKLIKEMEKLGTDEMMKHRGDFWYDIEHLGKLKSKLSYVIDETLREKCSKIIDLMDKEMRKCDLSNIKRGIVHGDINVSNIIIQHDPLSLAGFIDFNDSHVGFYVFDIASILSDVMMLTHRTHPKISILKAVKIVLDNILKSVTLSHEERQLLYPGIVGRCVLIIVTLSVEFSKSQQAFDHCKIYMKSCSDFFMFLFDNFSRKQIEDESF